MTTPIRRQYLQLKRQYPDAILFFRLGDFYETFDEDAQLIAGTLNIVLTSRDVGQGQKVPMAGVPYHAAETYIARLIKAGYKVAVCEQVGSPSASGLMEREVVQVVTPGTVVEPELLDAKQHNYLAALAFSDGRAGLAYVARQPVVLAVLGISLILGSLGRNYQVTMAAMTDGPLGGGAAGYGVLSAAFAAGTVLGGLVAASRTSLGLRTLIGAGVITSILQITGGLAPNVATLAGIVVPVALGAVLIDTTVATRIQLDTDWSMRGRVLGVATAVSGASGAVGAPLLGWLSEAIGPRLTLVGAGATTLIACVLAGAAFARLRGIPWSLQAVLGRRASMEPAAL